MKTVMWACLIFFSCSAWSQPEISEKFLNQINLKKIDSPNSYMFKYEVSNFAYKEMLYYAAKKDSDIFYSMVPDTFVWRSPLTYNEKYVEYYFHHPAFRDYPVVGVSHEQALLFCEMMTDIFNSKILVDNAELEEVVFRLPTENEWEAAARAGHPYAIYPWQEEGVRNAKTGEMLANFRRSNNDYMGVAGSLNDGSDLTAPVESYRPNDFGLYNMAGNVAEMVAEKGVSKGGGWTHGALNLIIDSVFKYEDPEPWLGFRYVMEVVKFREQKIQATELNAKLIEKTFVFVDTSNLSKTLDLTLKFENTHLEPYYVSSIETPNYWYKIFLNDIKASNPELYKTCLPGDSLWMKETNVLNYSFYSTQQHFNSYPVVNITKEAALHFCAWLTDRYNNDARRAYNKVIFNLPLDEEIKVVHLNVEDISYFFHPQYNKGKAIYPVNFHPYDERYFVLIPKEGKHYDYDYCYPENDGRLSRGLDGYDLLAPVDGFPKDDMGIYNMFGNAGEMVLNEDYSVGGSWAFCFNDYGYFIEETQTLPSPQVGFRMVMHVVEE